MARVTADVLALRIMLGPGSQAQKDRALAALRKAVEKAREPDCPACGETGPHEDNGATRQADLSYVCRSCGEQFDAEPV